MTKYFTNLMIIILQTGLLTAEGDAWIVNRLRPLEARLAARALKRGVVPPPHPLLAGYGEGGGEESVILDEEL